MTTDPREQSADTFDTPHIRVGCLDDLDALHRLACAGGIGLTNLPPDRNALAAKLAASERACVSVEARAAGSAILLVTELGGEIVGTSCIFAAIGVEWPFYTYRITRQAAISRALERTKAQLLLNLANDFDGEAEIGGLFVDPVRRGEAIGGLTARARYMFIAAHREWFGRRVIAEMRGYQDGDGRAPVWEALGRHFYDMEFHEADRTGALSGNQFIADLGPRYPIYVSLLPTEAQAALGRPHDDGRRAYAMLIAEGFRAGDYVDIFDGGPTLVADIDAVRSVREALTMPVAAIGAFDAGLRVLASTGLGPDFRAAHGRLHLDREGALTLAPEFAATLSAAPGDLVTYVPA